ncbi:MAG: TonB-dependent receptor domain-containing protein [Terriglobia bacterium]
MKAQAQASSASLSGAVYDSSGAAVPNANVTLASPSQGFERAFTTGQDGRYGFTLVPPGTYDLTVEGTGFKKYSQKGIPLEVGQSSTQDVTLQLGEMTQQVNVSAQAEILETQDPNIASTVTNRETTELPLDLRNVYGLVALNSSVNNSQQNQALNPPGSQGTADQDIAFFNFGGGRFGTTAFLLDGAWDAAGDWGGTIYVPGVDETQEFKISTNVFTAQYGWSMGNVVNAVTKSGTNGLHGDAWEFLRNNDLDANNFFNNAAGIPIEHFERNQFGFTVGGPIEFPKLLHKGKYFFFGDYEGLREATPLTFVANIPTSAMTQGNFSALLGAQIAGPGGTDALGRPVLSGQIYNPFTTRQLTTGQVDPTTGLKSACPGAAATCYIRDPIAGNNLSGMINSVSKNFLPYWPSPTGPGSGPAGTAVNNLTAAAGAPTNQDSYTGRVDDNISDKSRLFVRWSQKREFKQLEGDFYGASDVGGPGTLAPDNRWDAGFGYNRVFSPTLVMDFDFGWGRWDEGRKPEGNPFNLTSVGLPSFLNTEGATGSFPAINIDSMNGLGSGGLNGTPREARSYSIDFNKVHGAHTFNIGFMGVDFILNTLNSPQPSFNFPLGMTWGPDPTAATTGTGFGFASFLLGTGNGGGVTTTAYAALQKAFYGWYVQDAWKATRKLTVNLGLRYDIQTAPTDRFNRLSYFNPTVANPVAAQANTTAPGELVYTTPSNREVYDPQHSNFAPRLGFAYQAASKLVVRGGFGLFYIPAMEFGCYQGLVLNGFSQTTPYVGTIDGITPVNLLSNPFPGGLITPPGNSAGAETNVGFGTDAVLRNRPTPYVEQWSIGGQYAITPNDLLDISYVGNHGSKLELESTANFDSLPISDLAQGNGLLNNVANPFSNVITSSGCGLNGKTVLAGQLLLPFPEFCNVNYAQPVQGRSNYDALQVNFTHRWSGGLQTLLSYTYSKYLDDSDGPEGWTSGSSANYESVYNLRNEYSLDIDDIPHSFVASYIYSLPVGKGQRFASSASGITNLLVGGWQLTGVTTAKSGFPLGITANCNYAYCNAQRPNLVGNPNQGSPTVNEWFNTSAFAEPDPYTFGDVPRTMPHLRAPGEYTWDLAVQKNFHWMERFRLELGAEMFNAFNRVNFYAPNTSFNSTSFGTITGAEPARDIQIRMKLFW